MAVPTAYWACFASFTSSGGAPSGSPGSYRMTGPTKWFGPRRNGLASNVAVTAAGIDGGRRQPARPGTARVGGCLPLLLSGQSAYDLAFWTGREGPMTTEYVRLQEAIRDLRAAAASLSSASMNLRMKNDDGSEVTSQMTFLVGGLAQTADHVANLLETGPELG